MPIPDFMKNSLFDDAQRKDYITHEEFCELENNLNPKYLRCKAAASWFFNNGGKLEDKKLTPKNKATSKQLYKATQVLLRSYAPPHEIKIATVGKLLYDHCDEL